MDDFNLELESIDDSELDKELKQGLQYPCFVISGLLLEYEVEFLQGRKCEEGKGVPMYAYVNSKYVRVGDLEMTLDSMLSLRSVNEYDLALYRSPSDVTKIDLSNPETFLKYVSF